jgi:hypothetical protein
LLLETKLSCRLTGVSTGVLTTVLTTAGLGLGGGIRRSLIVGVSEETVSLPVCPKPLIRKIRVNKKEKVDFTQDDYGAKIYG